MGDRDVKKVDASRTNVGEVRGPHFWTCLGTAHDQVGNVEVHDGYLHDLFLRVFNQLRLNSQSEWIDSVVQTMDATHTPSCLVIVL